jgi:Protein of unknown function (DUF2846)
MTSSVRAALVAALLVSTGCASVPMMPEADDQAAKAFTAPPADRAQVYVYRNENFGGAVKLGILLDGFMTAESAAKTYVLLPVAPGRHVVASVAENREELPIDAVAGQTYFVWQEVKMGVLAARSKLSLVNEATGKAGVSECKRAVAATPPAAPVAPVAAKPAVAPGS